LCHVHRRDRCWHVRHWWWHTLRPSRAGADTARPRTRRSLARRPPAMPPMCRTTWRRAGTKAMPKPHVSHIAHACIHRRPFNQQHAFARTPAARHPFCVSRSSEGASIACVHEVAHSSRREWGARSTARLARTGSGGRRRLIVDGNPSAKSSPPAFCGSSAHKVRAFECRRLCVGRQRRRMV
jgi:hypothetical protein